MGPISYIGPKNSRAARDRPEHNPRKIQPSRHRRTFAGRRPAGGRHHEFCARRKATHAAATRAALHAPSCGDQHPSSSPARNKHVTSLPPIVRPAHDVKAPSELQQRPDSMAQSRGQRTARRRLSRDKHAGSRPASWPSRRNILRETAAHRAANRRDFVRRITDSAWKNKLVVVSVQYGPFNPYIPIRSTTIGKSRVAIDPIAMRTSWRSNSDIASVTSIGYPRMSASGESSTTMHRLLHASGSHPIPPPNDPKFQICVVRDFFVVIIAQKIEVHKENSGSWSLRAKIDASQNDDVCNTSSCMWETPTAGFSLRSKAHANVTISSWSLLSNTTAESPSQHSKNVDQHVSPPQSISRQKQNRPAATLRNELKPADATRHAYFTLSMQTPAGSYSTFDQR
ncbi:hypothetical protein F511_17011 [Dorcoceras hygrometricum]|uniref:Uncharacterized protein n=1 Tax=Dorcoceras hygrometricum TaxID=472368 RepID=A0A2Z7C3X7_9LAMI|nr:hypothetical protein F511_17011 [Dorcoceras hygrometricum]